MVETDYGGMNEIFRLSAYLKNATSLEKMHTEWRL